ncbi:flagellin [Bradyrhizobium sp. LM2.7]
MSGIVLSSSVRQNLLSLQSTADLLATTQSRLSTGKKVNSALDNPTNFFTAQSLDNRASDINNLLDGIANGVQVLQAANTGITSLQKLLDSAKSIANQALQTTVGYSTKSNVSTTIAGATSTDLRGTTTYSSATALSNVLFSGAAGGVTAATSTTTLGASAVATYTGTAINAATTAASLLNGTAAVSDANAGVVAGDTFTVNGKTITFASGDAPSTAPTGFTKVAVSAGVTTGNVYTDASGNSLVYLGSTTKASVGDVLTAIDVASGAQSNVAGTLTLNAGQTASTVNGSGALLLESSTGADLSVSGKADILKALGLTTATGTGSATVTAARVTASGSLGSFVQDGSTLNVNGKTITFQNGGTPAAAQVASGSGVSGNVVTDGSGNSTVYLNKGTIADVLKAIDLATGVQTASNSGGTATLSTATGQTNSSLVAGSLHISTGANTDLSITGTGNALSSLGLTGSTGTGTAFTASRTAASGGVSGKTLTFSSFNGGTAVNVTIGDGTGGTVKTLDQLNTALQANNLSATIDANGLLTVSATNDYASSTIGSASAGGTIGGTITSALSWSNATTPVADAVAQATRTNLVSQYNNIMTQIDTTSLDASFNGVNLLNGDQLKLVFDETGKSNLNITGVTFNSKGLGLAGLVQGTDFIDNAATNKVLTSLNSASSTLRSEASTLGSNLSIVQIRQDFNKNLINVLQTGSSNLTLADTNEEAANSQALSTRQSIAVSALSLANQSQQSVLQLLR